jgi:hypothetical protein
MDELIHAQWQWAVYHLALRRSESKSAPPSPLSLTDSGVLDDVSRQDWIACVRSVSSRPFDSFFCGTTSSRPRFLKGYGRSDGILGSEIVLPWRRALRIGDVGEKKVGFRIERNSSRASEGRLELRNLE